MMVSEKRQLFFDPITGGMRFDLDYLVPDNIPEKIKWPMSLQRENKKFGFKNLTLALTMKCNLDCDYCWQHHGLVPDMEKTTIDSWLDFFLDKQNNLPNKILYYGGEPLLRMDLIEYSSQRMKRLCKERNLPEIKQHIFTNATLLTDDNLDILQREKIFLILSIDGNPQVNSEHRHTAQGKEITGLVMQGVEKLHKRGIKFGVCCTLSEVDFDPNNTVGFILENIRPDSIELNLRHDAEFCKLATQFENQYLNSFCSAWDMILQSDVKNIDLRKRLNAIVNGIPLQNSSSGSKNKLAVMTNGMISSFNGAVSYPELQVLPEGEWIEKFKSRWKRNVLVNNSCKKCRAAFICGQGSAFSSYLQYGDFDHTPALHCEYCKTMLHYILEKIKKYLLTHKEIPYGYVVSITDIYEAFPRLFDKYDN